MSKVELPEALRVELAEAVDRFVAYGGILDRQTRRYMAAWVQEKLVPGVAELEGLDPDYFKHFQSAIGDILEDALLQEICGRHIHLAVQIAGDLLVWFRRTFAKLEQEHPHTTEETDLDSWTVRPMSHVLDRWEQFRKALSNWYTSDEVDPAYHTAQVLVLRNAGSYADLSSTQQEVLGRLFDDLLRQWDARLQVKILAFRLKQAQPEIETLGDNLLGKAHEFKQLDELIEPFADYASRYWDLSRDLWSNQSFDVIAKYRDLLDKEDELRKLADMLGKLRQAELITEEETFTQTVEHRAEINDPNRKEEVIGIFESSDLNHLVSSEVALLSEPETESVFLKRFAEKALLTQEFETRVTTTDTEEEHTTFQHTKKKEKGPFIVCVDTSGSMEGEPEQIAKVLCFGIMKMASAENRRAYLINFSTGVQTLDLLNIADHVDTLAHFLQMSFMGGTDISLALHEALEQLQKHQYEDADVLVISDFIMYKLDQEVARRMAFQQVNHNTKFHSLIITDEGNPAIIDLFDNVWLYDPNEKGIFRSIREDVSTLMRRKD